ncbi:DUF3618 domain-containing protein [Celeribacter indicus]|uniref:DUF3618 domain-containing protein n=1 Tax=Celeribacter indicus TaxID=1208324 RepID=A0A0B5E052_9RHOB|nr:DUF3618 domain-containing protein [Celeribacter indicus]AJE49078.1 hypothetical protein P73_4363 [Celeribacter indicus]SDW45322.1 Protein of unknown function [Celeribacter indicus]
MSDSRNPNAIERDIERERSELADTLQQIQSRFTPEAVIRQVSREVQLHGGDIGRSISKSVKQNPVGLTLTAVGLAWLVFGRSYEEEGDSRLAGDPVSRRLRARHRADDPEGGLEDDYDPYDYDTYEDAEAYAASSVPPSQRLASRRTYRDDYTAEEEPVWARPRAGLGEIYRPDYYDDLEAIDFDDEEETDRAFGDRVSDVQSRLRDRYHASRGAVSDAAGSASDAAGHAGERVGAAAAAGADRLGQARDRVYSTLQDGYDNIAAGTEKMSEEARERVIAARERAIIAGRRAKRAAKRGQREATDYFEEHPLVAGAIALALGAAIGGALPRTRAEDKYVGDYSDALFDDAERIYREERRKFRAVAEAVKDEGEEIARDARAEADARTPGDKSAEYAAADAVRGAAERIEAAAREEAREQGLVEEKTSPGSSGS